MKTLEESYYAQFGGPFQGGGYRATTPRYYQRNNANPSYQERRQSMEDTLSKFLSESAKRHEENSNLIKEIRATTDAAIRNQGASIKTLEIQIGQMSKVLQERGFGSLPSSTKTNPRDQVKWISTTIKADSHPIHHFIILDMLEDIKVPLILGRPFLSIARSKIDVYKRKITLRVGEEKIIFKSIKPASSLIRRVYILGLRERIELDLGARLMEETLVLNRSLDLFLEEYIELNDLNEQVELRRNQGDDLMPTIMEGEVIEEFRTRYEDLDTGIDDYPILENMDAYRDNGMGDVIVGEPFLREVRIKAKRFEGIITFYKGDDEVSEKDKKNGISHAYQNLKGFYKGVLNLGPDYIRNAKTGEWLTRGHISVHEME
ncbi:hypothetical protein Tco_0944847 [Tanacetum coccineum]